MFTFLEESYSPLEGDVTAKAHHSMKAHPILPLVYHHEGDSQPLVVDLKGGHQTLTNEKWGNHNGRFLSEELLPT